MNFGKNTKPVNRKDIQGIVASGYDHLDHARFVFLKIFDRKAAKHWLSNIVEQITTAEHPGDHKSDSCLNLAVSWQGLHELGVSELIRDFPHEFVKGMNRDDADLILGDQGESSHEHWDYGADAARPLHLLLLLYGKTASDLQLLQYQIYRPSAFVDGLRIVAVQDAFRKPHDYFEPFGFRDGISQPPVQGLVGRRPQSEHPINTGEFVLGYKNELDQFTRIPSVNNWDDPRGYLGDHPEYPGRCRAFGLNGTYLVFRKLLQKVDEFRMYIDKMSRDPDPHRARVKRELLAAQMVGRWKSGAPLVLSPESPGAEPRNDFLFMTLDPDGLRCPIGSHIRRANPRDSLDMPPSRSIMVSRRHRLIRRGRKFSKLAKDSPTDNPKFDQGIYFIALNADLRRQFEFVQQLWINNPTFNDLDIEKDPIVGDNASGGEFTVQERPFNKHYDGLPRFVTVRGGGYFFVPGISAIRFLANHQA
jgi:Dyp-type peroxidase family